MWGRLTGFAGCKGRRQSRTSPFAGSAIGGTEGAVAVNSGGLVLSAHEAAERLRDCGVLSGPFRPLVPRQTWSVDWTLCVRTQAPLLYQARALCLALPVCDPTLVFDQAGWQHLHQADRWPSIHPCSSNQDISDGKSSNLYPKPARTCTG